MTTFFVYDDAVRNRELRHEIAEPISDPIGFIEHDGTRIVVGGILEEPIFATREDIVDEFWQWHDFGYEELVKDASISEESIGPEVMVRALNKLGVTSVSVPPSLGVLTADHLRAAGVEVVVDAAAWTERRRHKTPGELEGTERAQRAAETAMLTAARMLRDAEPTGRGELRFEGEILTAELIRESMVAELLTQGAESEEIIVHSGDACLSGHELGSGAIAPDATCIIDCFPRDRRSGAYADMTRTFVPGTPSDEAKKLHSHCKAALEIALEALKPGRADAYAKVADYFHEHGYPSARHNEGHVPLREGFFHALGHGVGLEVHERPWMGRRSDELLEGDVVAVEPGLYFAGVGGIRLEDIVLITDEGVEYFTDPFSYDLQP